MLARHAIEAAVERLQLGVRVPTRAERRIGALSQEAVALNRQLGRQAGMRFRAVLASTLEGEATLVPLFHLLRTAAMQRARGFNVAFTGLQDGTRFDLLLSRGGIEAGTGLRRHLGRGGTVVAARCLVASCGSDRS